MCGKRRKNRGGPSDRTRCDCLTDDYAIEFDFGKKWAEAIGQSLYYSLQTGKQAGIVLILEDPKDYKYWIRLNTTIDHFGLPIKTWKMEIRNLKGHPKRRPFNFVQSYSYEPPKIKCLI